MTPALPFRIRQLTADDGAMMHALLTTFGDAFDEADNYGKARPSAAYLGRLLDSEDFIALVALKGEEVIGGLTAYVLRKFEQERSEVYITTWRSPRRTAGRGSRRR